MFFESDFRLKNQDDRQFVEDIIRKTRGKRKLKAITGTQYEEMVLRMQQFIYLCSNQNQLSWFKTRLRDNTAGATQKKESNRVTK